MISLLRRNRKQSAKGKEGPLTRSHISDQQQSDSKLYHDSSLDSLVFAASLGLVSTQHQHTPKDMLLLMQDEAKQKQRQQHMEFHCRFCGKEAREPRVWRQAPLLPVSPVPL
jgi:hypothetical protein